MHVEDKDFGTLSSSSSSDFAEEESQKLNDTNAVKSTTTTSTFEERIFKLMQVEDENFDTECSPNPSHAATAIDSVEEERQKPKDANAFKSTISTSASPERVSKLMHGKDEDFGTQSSSNPHTANDSIVEKRQKLNSTGTVESAISTSALAEVASELMNVEDVDLDTLSSSNPSFAVTAIDSLANDMSSVSLTDLSRYKNKPSYVDSLNSKIASARIKKLEIERPTMFSLEEWNQLDEEIKLEIIEQKKILSKQQHTQHNQLDEDNKVEVIEQISMPNQRPQQQPTRPNYMSSLDLKIASARIRQLEIERPTAFTTASVSTCTTTADVCGTTTKVPQPVKQQPLVQQLQQQPEQQLQQQPQQLVQQQEQLHLTFATPEPATSDVTAFEKPDGMPIDLWLIIPDELKAVAIEHFQQTQPHPQTQSRPLSQSQSQMPTTVLSYPQNQPLPSTSLQSQSQSSLKTEMCDTQLPTPMPQPQASSQPRPLSQRPTSMSMPLIPGSTQMPKPQHQFESLPQPHPVPLSQPLPQSRPQLSTAMSMPTPMHQSLDSLSSSTQMPKPQRPLESQPQPVFPLTTSISMPILHQPQQRPQHSQYAYNVLPQHQYPQNQPMQYQSPPQYSLQSYQYPTQ
eukprot:Awhi_evm1s13503